MTVWQVIALVIILHGWREDRRQIVFDVNAELGGELRYGMYSYVDFDEEDDDYEADPD